MGALSAGLALPFSFLVQAAPLDEAYAAARAGVATSAPDAADGSVLSRWHDYALSSITPQFSWAVLPPSYGAPRVLDNYSGVVARTPLFQAQQAATTHLAIAVATGNVADTPNVLPDQSVRLTGLPQSGLQRTVVAPTLSGDWGSHGSFRLTGVLAYQRFASLGLGTTDGWAPRPAWINDSSYGAGARIDVDSALSDRLHWNLGYQSRVGMGAFANYRGVFADPGDFDIPASASANFSYALTPQFGVDIGLQRVMYSAITPFTSSSLPTRFLALLGDGGSPVFAWRDLNVYSVGWTLRDADIGALQLRYTTRQQPVPTSKLLERALASATANDTVSLGWSRGFGANSNLSFAASYATSSYYLLMPSYLARNDGTASQFEFEANWLLRF
jgi:hypothetical protein